MTGCRWAIDMNSCELLARLVAKTLWISRAVPIGRSPAPAVAVSIASRLCNGDQREHGKQHQRYLVTAEGPGLVARRERDHGRVIANKREGFCTDRVYAGSPGAVAASQTLDRTAGRSRCAARPSIRFFRFEE